MAEYIKLKDAINGAMMMGIKPCPFCGGNAEEVFLKRKKLFASMRFPLQYALCIHTV